MKILCENENEFQDFKKLAEERWGFPICYLAMETRPEQYPCILYFTEIIDFKEHYVLCMFCYESDFKIMKEAREKYRNEQTKNKKEVSFNM